MSKRIEKGQMELNPIAKEWVAALRSGEYKQIRGTLHNNDGYCCLGVLCDLAVKHGVEINVSVEKDGRHYYGLNANYLNSVIAKWAGIDVSCDPSNPAGLATMNDSGYSFTDIADYIETNPCKIFGE